MHKINLNKTNTDHNILQWNINGFYKKIDDLKRLIHKYSPLVICLQETNFSENHIAELKGYFGYSKNRSVGG
jgi:exonuclease III